MTDNMLLISKITLIIRDWGPTNAGVTPHVEGLTDFGEDGADFGCDNRGRGVHEHFLVNLYCYNAMGGRGKYWLSFRLLLISRSMTVEKAAGRLPPRVWLID